MIYVLQVQPGYDIRTAADLRRAGLSAFAPRRELFLRKNGLIHKQVDLLFPGYVFYDGEYSADIFHRAKGVNGVIRFLGEPSPLPKKEELLIRWLCNDGNILEESAALVDDNNNIVSFEGVLGGHEQDIVHINRRQKRATVQLRFDGKLHKANLAFELKRMPR